MNSITLPDISQAALTALPNKATQKEKAS